MWKKLVKGEGGFTLIELLVTIAILGVLFGIVTLTLTGVGANAETTVNDAEAAVVQSAIDIAMAENNLQSVTALSPAACLDGSETLATGVTLGDYIRLSGGSSKCQYSWTADGTVTQAPGCTTSTCP